MTSQLELHDIWWIENQFSDIVPEIDISDEDWFKEKYHLVKQVKKLIASLIILWRNWWICKIECHSSIQFENGMCVFLKEKLQRFSSVVLFLCLQHNDYDILKQLFKRF